VEHAQLLRGAGGLSLMVILPAEEAYSPFGRQRH